ncbi:10652_t:CDS:2 [Paraglomus brasilianum]|uniref:10652_t:CDS:1 n=1 Tax=Paraglomus brasilianum TaxID=144538 RepID=A0A9N9F7S7_9GLOM|nr:10652_t:CDS:2 [Paraglomus brasilianum]
MNTPSTIPQLVLYHDGSSKIKPIIYRHHPRSVPDKVEAPTRISIILHTLSEIFNENVSVKEFQRFFEEGPQPVSPEEQPEEQPKRVNLRNARICGM